MASLPDVQNIPIRTLKTQRVYDALKAAGNAVGGPTTHTFTPMSKAAAEEFARLFNQESPFTGHLATPRTDAELLELRADAVAPDLEAAADNVYDDAVRFYGPGYFTCDNCPNVRACGFAFDLYNVDGDCLLNK